jgi:DNA-directed RNA polymerase specialized sigma24 family protein
MGEERDFKRLGEELHHRLLAGKDNLVTAEIAELFLPPLAQALTRRFPHLSDPHQTATAAIDSLLAYFAHPEKFDPAKGSLLGYLYLDASRDLLNFLRRLKKVVELHMSLTEYETQAIAPGNPETLLLAKSSPIVDRALARLDDPTDRELAALMMDGVRETSAFAAALGVANRSLQEQEKIVKRHKDRLKKTLQRGLLRPRSRK